MLVLLLLLCAESVFATGLRVEFARGLAGWEEKRFNGRTDYRLVEDSGRKVLQAESRGQASALIYWSDVDPNKTPILRWRWKIDRVLQDGRAGTRAGDDYPARIYIIFDSWLPNYARSLNYIWASHLAREEVVVNPYYERSIMLAVESGAAKVGGWVVEERDLRVDYQRMFGGEIPKIRAVAVMSDGDDTGESARAWFDWIEFVAE